MNGHWKVLTRWRKPCSAYLLLSIMLMLSSLAASSVQADGETPPKQTAIALDSTANLQEIRNAVIAAGSEITHSVATPDGGTILSVNQPADATQAKILHSQIGNLTGVTTVEDNACLEIFPVDNPQLAVTANFPWSQGQTPENFIAGGNAPWTGDAISQSASGEFLTSDIACLTETQVLPGVTLSASGWDQTTEEPPTYTPIEYDGDPDYCEATVHTIPGPEPALKLIFGVPGDFPYPRPIPLQLKVRDYDYLQVGCEGCDETKGNNRKPIEDTGIEIQWNAKNKGALNEPFIDLDEIEEKIAELREKIQRLSELLEQKKTEKARDDRTRAERLIALEGEIAQLRADKAEAQANKETAESELAALEEELKAKKEELKTALNDIKGFEDDIAAKEKEIEELRKKVAGEPIAEEQALAARLEAIQQRIEQKQAELEQLLAEQQAREQALAQAYDAAEQNLDDARQRLADARAQVQAKQNEITALENQLYSNPVLRNFVTQRSQALLSGQRLKSDYLQNSSLPVSPASEVTNLASSALQSPGAEQMQSLFDQFSAAKDQLIGDLGAQCNALGGVEAAACNSAVQDLSDQLDEMSNSLQEAISNPQSLVDPQVWEDLQKARQELADLESNVANAEQQVRAAEQALEQALEAYISGLRQLEQEQQNLLNEITRLQDEADQANADLREATLQKELEREKNTPQWIADIAALRTDIEGLLGKIAEQRRKAQAAQEEIDQLEKNIAIKKAQIQEILVSIDNIQRKIDEKLQEKEALATESDRLQEEIDEIQEDLDQAKQDLIELETQESSATNKNKNAFGPLVYYIPPPLEVILSDEKKEEFTGFKREVGRTEGEYEEAKGKKSNLQDRAFKIIKGMTEQLWALKTAKDRIKSLEAEIKALEIEITQRETELVNENLEQLRQEQAEKERLEQEKKTADEKAKDAKEEEEREKGDVEVAQANVDRLVKEKDTAQKDVWAKIEQLRIQTQLRQRKAEVVIEQGGTHTRTTAAMRDQEAELGRINDAIARQSSAGNDAGVANLRQAAQAAQRQLDTIKQQFETEQRTLKAAADDLKLAMVAERDAKQQEEAAQKQLLSLQRELRRARQELRKQTEELDEFTEKRLAAEREARLADEAVKDQDEKIKKTKDEKIDESEEIKSKEKTLKEKKEEKNKAEGDKNSADAALKKLIEQREQWKQDKQAADSEVKNAEKALEEAEKALKDFITDEFKTINYIETIELIVTNNKPLDEWRAPDSEVKDKIIIHYGGTGGTTTVVRGSGSRIATIIGPDDNLEPPAAVNTPATCNAILDFDKDDKIELLPEEDSEDEAKPRIMAPPKTKGLEPEPIGLQGVEPQTVALFYKAGQPLYELWPPRKETEASLQRAASHWKTAARDIDTFTTQCTPEGGIAYTVGLPEAPTGYCQQCLASKASTADIKDVVHPEWMEPSAYTDREEMRLHLRVPDVPEDQCGVEVDVKVEYTNIDEYITKPLQAGDKKEKNDEKFKGIKPGMVGDFAEKVSDFDSQNKVQLKIQIFDGAHKGLGGEQIEWKVGNFSPDIHRYKYGLTTEKKKDLTVTTNADGYSKVDFYLEEQYGKGEVEVKWTRGGAACKTKTITIERLLAHRFIYKGFGPKDGWDTGTKFFNSGDSDPAAYLAELPAEGADKVPMISTGLLDDQRDPVLEKTIEFEAPTPAGVSMDPDSVTTKEKTYALAWSFAQDVPEDSELEMLARVESSLTDYIGPEPYEPEYKESLSAKTAKKFRIGVPGAYITIETDEPFIPGGDPYTGGAKISIEGPGSILDHFVNLQLQANGIKTKESGGDVPIAQEGTVTWSTDDDANAHDFRRAGIVLLIKKLGLTAGAAGIVGGKFRVPTTEKMAGFNAMFGPDGFIGEVSDFPEIELAGFKLAKGAAVVIDMYTGDGPGAEPEPRPTNWPDGHQGLYIRTATIYLPEALKGDAEKPPAISATDLQVGAGGVTGKLSLEYPISASIGKLQFAINKVTLELRNNEPEKAEIEGALSFPDPFIGEAQITLSVARENNFSLTVRTEKPVAAPKLGLVFAIHEMTGKYENEIFSFEITAAFVKSENFSDITIRDFKFDSTGNISAERIEINQDLKIGGFQAHLIAFGFKVEDGEYALSLETKFQFGEILKADEVNISIVTGPRIDKFKLSVTGDKKPVKFKAEIKYEASLFEGELEVELENLFKIKGIFVMGAQKTGDEEWSYWYIELNLEADRGIPIAQTGLSLLGIGGGLGYNYDPPIGAMVGAARKTDSFSFKASITIGNAPGGEVFTGRLSMVLVSGRFTLNGKVWLLEKEDSLFGEGQISLYFDQPSRLEGYVRMVVALPGAEGKLIRFNGIVDFYYGGGRKEIKSRTLEGTLLERIIAEGNIEVTPGKAHLDGTLKYDMYKEIPLAVATLKVQVNLRAQADLDIAVTSSGASLNASATFNGNWDVNLYTRVREFDIVSGSVSANLTLSASTGGSITVSGSVDVTWDTWVYSGSTSVDLGFSM